jgi:predicted O-linked N-acetylglucosamine transferase (SPINDLY family)
MDGLIADPIHVPPGEDLAYTETIVRLPDTCFCYEPAVDAPAVGALPALSANGVCFGCFNNPAKVNRDVIALWASILERLPGAKLFFAYAGYEVPLVQDRILGWFAEAKISGDRIRFGGRLPRREHLARYGEIDLALDPKPYSGSTTTVDALWMGVPVVTMPGRTFAGRHSTSHLTVVGLTETIASDAASYVGIACRLAADLPRLTVLRAGLRARVAASPLCDGPRFALHLESAFRALWQEWCARAVG